MEPTPTTQEQLSNSERIEEKPQEPSEEEVVSASSRQPSTTNSGELRRRHRGSISKEGESSTTVEKEKNVIEEDGFYECNICFDTATNAVLTLCGHLFCWPCLHQWLSSQPQNPLCPVCKAGCGKDKVIPIYGRGKEAKDPRQEAIPSRPAGQRPAPLRDPNIPRQIGLTHIGGVPLFSNSNVQVSLGGFGLFPGMFGVQFSFPSGPNHMGQNGAGNQQAFMSRMALMCALLILVAIVFS